MRVYLKVTSEAAPGTPGLSNDRRKNAFPGHPGRSRSAVGGRGHPGLPDLCQQVSMPLVQGLG